jgi:colanic acid biosynthesis glycosyl transferase WcaI
MPRASWAARWDASSDFDSSQLKGDLMRILLHTIFYSPDLTGVAKYTAELCEWLAARGHEVSVVAPPPYYPQWKVRRPYSSWRYTSDRVDRVLVRRCPIWVPGQPRGIGRIVYALSFALSSLPVMLREAWRGTDLVMVIEPSFFNLPVSLFAARIGRSMTWLHVQDFEIDLAYDMGQLSRGRGFAARIESWMMKRFDTVSSISRRLLQKARSKGVPAEALFFLPNSVDISEIQPTAKANSLRTELGIDVGQIVALFSGSLGAKQGIETIVDAARILKGERTVLFVICGEGVSAEKLHTQAKGLENLRFLPLQPANRLNELLAIADMHLLPQQPTAAASVFPSKLIAMLASGKPVIAACRPGSDIADHVSDCGIITEPGDPVALSSAIRNLATDEATRARMGACSRERALKEFGQRSTLLNFEREMFDRVRRCGRTIAEAPTRESLG